MNEILRLLRESNKMDLDEAREVLGEGSENLTDDELNDAIETAELLADIAFGFLFKKSSKKNP